MIGILMIINKLKKRAIAIWYGEKSRCNKINNPEYKYYGGRGIKCVWTMKECIAFYIKEYAKRDNWKQPCIARFNDNGNYELGNVKLIERSENSAEIKRTPAMIQASKRNANFARKFLNIDKLKKKVILINNYSVIEFESIVECAKELDVTNCSTISARIKRKTNVKYNDDVFNIEYFAKE
jgi:hypothetical protein